MTFRSILVFAHLFFGFHFTQAKSFSFSGDHLRGELLSPAGQVGEGQAFPLALRFQMDPEWHVYWKNPGDSGAAPKVFIESDLIVLQKILWPKPERINVGPLTNFGYEKEVILPLDVMALKKGRGSARVELEWLICKVECIPGFAELVIPVTISAETVIQDTEMVSLIDSWRAKTPQAASTLQIVSWSLQDNFVEMKIKANSEPKAFEIFPIDPMIVKNAVSPTLKWDIDRMTVRWETDSNYSGATMGSWLVSAVLDGASELAELAAPPKAEFKWKTLFKALLFAFLGGAILNLMPCVFPVLSIKVLSFSKDSPTDLKISGWLYTLGVVLSFLILGGLLLILRATGESFGWGFQLQNPMIVGGLSILFALIGFSFLGWFEVGDSLTRLSPRWTQGNGRLSALGTGILATIIATPCTAPFMGVALGASLTLPPFFAMVVFLSLGFGMAFPFLLLCLFPAWLKKLPRPGVWMTRLKEFFAFPMFVTTLWLLWVLGYQSGVEGVLLAVGFLLFTGFLIWLKPVGQKRWWLLVVWIFGFAMALRTLPQFQPGPSTSTEKVWQNYSEENVQNALAKNHAVFVDFTAKWCITCQVNKRTVLETESIQALFKSNNVVLFQADWTNHDPLITQALSRLGRNSVPVYAFYSSGQKTPILLPEILTSQTIEKLFQPGGTK